MLLFSLYILSISSSLTWTKQFSWGSPLKNWWLNSAFTYWSGPAPVASSEDGSLLRWKEGEEDWGGKAGEERPCSCTELPCNVVCGGHRCKRWQQKDCSPQSFCPAWFRGVYRCSLPAEESHLLMEDVYLPSIPRGREAPVQLQWNWSLNSLKRWVRGLTHVLVICMSQKTPHCGSRVVSSVEGRWCPVTVTWTTVWESLHRAFKMDVRQVSQFPLSHLWINYSRFLAFHIKTQLTLSSDWVILWRLFEIM